MLMRSRKLVLFLQTTVMAPRAASGTDADMTLISRDALSSYAGVMWYGTVWPLFTHAR